MEEMSVDEAVGSVVWVMTLDQPTQYHQSRHSLRSTVREASLWVHKWAICGAKRFASRPYLPGRLDWSTSQVSSRAPLGLVARGIEFNIMPAEIRF